MPERGPGDTIRPATMTQPTARRGSALVTLCALAAAGCAGAAPDVPTTHVDRVIEDVTAIVEGMARAHDRTPQTVEIPGLRSTAPAQRP